MLLVVAALCFFIQLAAGNVEKTIFVAPPPSTVPTEDTATIDDLGLDRLSPAEHMLRTTLQASFPTEQQPYGSESWFYLEDLNPGQRYEVRICWLATQPTAFSLTTYPFQEIVSDPSLLPAVLEFSSSDRASSPLLPPKARLHDSSLPNIQSQQKKPSDSILFIRIYAAADYFTTNTTLMAHVPPVAADIILDPFLFNIFPRSLVPTAVYTVIIAIVAYFVSGVLASSLTGIISSALGRKEEDFDSDAGMRSGGVSKKVENKKRR